MHSEFNMKVAFHCPNKEAMVTFIKACRQAMQELSTQAALLSGETPIIDFTIENNQIGTKKINIFNGADK